MRVHEGTNIVTPTFKVMNFYLFSLIQLPTHRHCKLHALYNHWIKIGIILR